MLHLYLIVVGCLMAGVAWATLNIHSDSCNDLYIINYVYAVAIYSTISLIIFIIGTVLDNMSRYGMLYFQPMIENVLFLTIFDILNICWFTLGTINLSRNVCRNTPYQRFIIIYVIFSGISMIIIGSILIHKIIYSNYTRI